MAGNVIKEFLVSLGFQVDKSSEKGFTDGIGKATIAVAGIGAAAIAAGALVTKFVSGIASELAPLQHLANRTDTAAGEIDRLGYIASLTDSSVQAVNSTMDQLSMIMGEAATGLGRGAKAFEHFGLSVKKQDGTMKSTTEMLSEVGDYIKDMDRPSQLSVLRRLGIDPTMINMLTGDMAALSAEYETLYSGLGLDMDDAAQASADFMDSQFKLKFVFDALKKSVAAEFMPQLMRGMDSLRKGLIENLPKIMAVVKPIMGGILSVAGAIITLGARAGAVIGKVIEWLWNVSKATNHWVLIIGGVIAAWKLLNLTFLLSPIGMILALSAALLLLYDDFMTWKEGGKSLIDWGAWATEIDIVIEYFKVLWDWIDMAVSGITNALIALIQVLTGDFSGAWETVQFQVEKFMDVVGKAANLIKKVGGYFGIGDGAMPDIPASAGAGGGATVNQTINNNIQSTDPEATGRAAARETTKGIQDVQRNMTAVPAY